MVKNISTDNSKSRTLTLASGVVLNIHRVSSMLFGDLTRRHPRPKPPKWMNPDTGREEDNRDDPGYLQMQGEWEVNISMSMIDNMIIMGTSINEVPKEFPKLDDIDWIDRLEAGGFVIGTNKAKRYLSYVKYIACADNDDDISAITESVGKLSGVSDKDVNDAVDRFRDNPGRRTDNSVSS